MAKLEERICKHCGKFYMPTHQSNKYCSEECRYTAKKIKIKENNKKAYAKMKKPTLQKKCLVCRKKFKTVRSDVVTCSPFCQKIRRQEQRKEREQIKKEEEKRKANQPKPMSIAEFDREARKMGMTYGQYDLYLRMHGKEQRNVI